MNFLQHAVARGIEGREIFRDSKDRLVHNQKGQKSAGYSLMKSVSNGGCHQSGFGMDRRVRPRPSSRFFSGGDLGWRNQRQNPYHEVYDVMIMLVGFSSSPASNDTWNMRSQMIEAGEIFSVLQTCKILFFNKVFQPQSSQSRTKD